MPLTEDEKVQVRHALGFLNVAEAATFVLGTPAGVETQFIIEGAMNRVLESALPLLRNHLAILAKIEAQMVDDLETLVVRKLGEIEIDPEEMPKLRREYDFWRQRLANILGVYANPFDKARYGGPGANFRVG